MRVVDPHPLDLGVVKEHLQGAEAGDPGDKLTDRHVVIGDRSDVLGDAAYDKSLALRVDTLATHPLAHLPIEALHQVEMASERAATDAW